MEHKNLDERKKLKIGIIVDSNMSSKYVYDLAKWAKMQEILEISTIIIQENTNIKTNLIRKSISSLRNKGLIHLINQIGYKIIVNVESMLLTFHEHHNDHLLQYDLLDYIKKVITVKPLVSKSGFIYRYKKEDIDNICNEKFDVLIRCGSGIIRGDILTIAKFGVLSFHHADNRINRGGPAGFWEVFNRVDSTGFIIQQLTDELDGGNVIYRGFFQTKIFFLLNQANLYIKSNFYMKKILMDLALNNKLPKKLESYPYFNKLFKMPVLADQVIYILKTINLITIKIFKKYVLYSRNRWSVGFNFSNWQNLTMWKSFKIINPKNHFLADPFVVSSKGKNYCFVEDYDYKKSKAAIALYELAVNGYTAHGLILEEKFHLSYPYIFEYKSKFYMIPETSENKDIRLYEAIEFPSKWKFKKIIFSNISAADTTVFQKNGLWWLFTNIDPVNIGDHSSELFIFYSENPLIDDWRPHPMNPVVCDSNKARMGGILFDEEFVYRVAQKQGFDIYGESFNINKILILNRYEFLEEEIINVKPQFFDGIIATHHLHSNKTISVFDFMNN